MHILLQELQISHDDMFHLGSSLDFPTSLCDCTYCTGVCLNHKTVNCKTKDLAG